MIKDKWPKFSFKGLLFILVLFFLVQPVFSETYYGAITLEALISFILVSTVYVISERKIALQIALLLVLPALLLNWSNFYSFAYTKQTIAFILEATFLIFAIVVMAKQVFQSKEIDVDVIIGSICIYTLAGLTWGILYTLLELHSPGAFAGDLMVKSALSKMEFRAQLTTSMNYYSFVTLCTLGYGDIIPISSLARSLSIIETLFGQFYIAITVATLVGMRTKTHAL